MAVTPLGEYVESIRRRHPRLSMSRMAREAGLNINAVQQIIKGGVMATPHTLKALADHWGTPGDYSEMMRLAGHPLPDGPQLSADEQELLQHYRWLNNEGKDNLLEILSQTNGTITGTEMVDRIEKVARSSGGLDRAAVARINRALLRFLAALVAMPDAERYDYLVERISELYKNKDAG